MVGGNLDRLRIEGFVAMEAMRALEASKLSWGHLICIHLHPSNPHQIMMSQIFSVSKLRYPTFTPRQSPTFSEPKKKTTTGWAGQVVATMLQWAVWPGAPRGCSFTSPFSLEPCKAASGCVTCKLWNPFSHGSSRLIKALKLHHFRGPHAAKNTKHGPKTSQDQAVLTIFWSRWVVSFIHWDTHNHTQSRIARARQ